MFAEPPPSAASVPPAIAAEVTAAQRSDLDCLSVGVLLANATHGAGTSPWAARLVRVYLGRLRSSDPSRDWLQMTTPGSEISYGWFMRRLTECQRPLRPAQPRPYPATVAPAQPPSQPTGG